jgi:hypothetical protein
MSKIPTTLSSILLSIFIGLSATLANTTAKAETDTQEQGKIIPLPPEVAKNLALLGEGVVGKAVPAPDFKDADKMLNIGPGTWKYKIVAGGKDGALQRTETYEEIEPYKGNRAWKRALGEQYIEYFHLDADGNFVKHSEDDPPLGYTTDFTPGIIIPIGLKPGETQSHKSTLRAFKTGERDKKGGYSGKATMDVTYVGAYEVTTPAGTWPAMLVETAFTIKIGPADVSDTTYVFVAPGIGRVAEVEVTSISAILVYHAHTKIAKVLSEYPKH